MGFAVIGCSKCQAPCAVDLRHRTSRCPRCQTQMDLRTRRRLWEGDDALQAAAASQSLASGAGARAGATHALPPPMPDRPRHDDTLDAAAAQGRSERNPSRRAEVVADWLCRLEGETTEERLLEALRRAGIDAARAEKERIRLLVQDHIYERRPGVYASL